MLIATWDIPETGSPTTSVQLLPKSYIIKTSHTKKERFHIHFNLRLGQRH
jgi:hypothetical protein